MPILEREKQTTKIGGGYAYYVLIVLLVVYVFNFIDRQILSILAEEIKADMGISDAEIGFLYGTVFAVFYAVFGIPLGRLADVWVRKSLISIGLGFWSLMTFLSGTARRFASLATFRIGVGVGEASASPAAFSLLSDYFPPKLRATALSIYSSGVYIGAGIGIYLGGFILDTWNGMFPQPGTAPFGLKGWHVAFFIVGLPGLLMAILVYTLREPRRGQSEGLFIASHPHPFKETWKELQSILPVINLFNLGRMQESKKNITMNLTVCVLIILICFLLYLWLGNIAQWTALGVGIYCAFSWSQTLSLRDPLAFNMIFRCRTICYASIGVPLISFVTYGVGFWASPFFIRVHGVNAAEVGKYLGLAAAIGGWMGVTTGGIVADKLRQYIVQARLYVALSAALFAAPFGLSVLYTNNLTKAYILNFCFQFFSTLWIGPAAATINDLVLPGLRAIASAFYILMITFIGLALGPFTIGKISDTLAMRIDAGEALRQAMMLSYLVLIPSVCFILLAIKNIKKDQERLSQIQSKQIQS